MTILNFLEQAFNFRFLGKCALWGAGIAISLFAVFILIIMSTEGPPESWNWLPVPMFTVTVGGACGGLFYGFWEPVRKQGSTQKILLNILSGLVFLVGGWISLVLGLAIVGLWD